MAEHRSPGTQGPFKAVEISSSCMPEGGQSNSLAALGSERGEGRLLSRCTATQGMDSPGSHVLSVGLLQKYEFLVPITTGFTVEVCSPHGKDTGDVVRLGPLGQGTGDHAHL